MKKMFLAACVLSVSLSSAAQYASPLRVPLLLSANFAECRANHFHSGIDIKTNGGHLPVYSIEQGYISRIFVSPSGYGLALYIDHPDGRTSVYGHLDRFTSTIQEYVRKKQYEQESYKIDIQVPKGLFPVQKGELIAYSGDSGSSGGPHLHFEIRNTRSEFLINPLLFYKKEIKDSKAPQLQSLMVYPIESSGVANNSSSPQRFSLTKSKGNNSLQPNKEIRVWGKIGLGLKAFDSMDQTYNSFGVTHIRLEMDNKEIFNYVNESYSFLVGRMFNSVIDYRTWRERNDFFLKSYIEAGNTFPFYKTINNGYIQINEERDYHFRYILEDLHGNRSEYSFVLRGEKQEIPQQRKTPYLFLWNKDNKFLSQTFTLNIPKGNIYTNFYFTPEETISSSYFSHVCRVNTFHVPLHSYCELKIKVDKDTLKNKSQYGIVQVSSKGQIWMGGKYENGFVGIGIRDLGDRFAVSSDTTPPAITPLTPELWVKKGAIRIRIADSRSGIQSVRGTIDGKFALFENDVKSPVYTYKIDRERIGHDRNHELHLIVKDGCNNVSEYSYSFTY